MKTYETSKGYKVTQYDETLHLTDCLTKRGYYRFCLYDTSRGMNIGTSDLSGEEALFNALKYYQKRLKEVEETYKALQEKVNKVFDLFEVEPVQENWND